MQQHAHQRLVAGMLHHMKFLALPVSTAYASLFSAADIILEVLQLPMASLNIVIERINVHSSCAPYSVYVDVQSPAIWNDRYSHATLSPSSSWWQSDMLQLAQFVIECLNSFAAAQ